MGCGMWSVGSGSESGVWDVGSGSGVRGWGLGCGMWSVGSESGVWTGKLLGSAMWAQGLWVRSGPGVWGLGFGVSPPLPPQGGPPMAARRGVGSAIRRRCDVPQQGDGEVGAATMER